MAEQLESDGAFEPISNRFTKAFYEEEIKRYESDDFITSPWIEPPFQYLTAVQLLTQSVSQTDFNDLFYSLQKLAHPQTGNPKGVMVLIGLLDNLIDKMQRVLSVDGSTRTTRTINAPQTSLTQVRGKTSKTPVRIFRDTKWFTNSSFDSNVKKHAGLRFLWMGELESAKNTDGLKEVDGGYYQARVNVETRKYFKSLDVVPNLYAGSLIYTDGDSLSNTSFTYLTPALIELPQASMNMLAGSKATDPYDGDYYSYVESNMLAYNSGLSFVAGGAAGTNLTSKAQAYSSGMGDFFASLNVTRLPITGWEPIPQTDHVAGRPSTTGEAETEIIDPIIQVHTSCDLDPSVGANSNPNSVWLGLSQRFLKNGATVLGNKNPFQATTGMLSVGNNYKGNEGAYSTTLVDTNTIEAYNLNSATNLISLMGQDGEMAASILAANGHHNVPATINAALLTLPNQVKCLFLGSTSPNLVKLRWHDHGYDPVKDLRTAAKFRLHHQMIVRVDRLVGYNKSNGKRHIKKADWKPLTKSDWTTSAGEAMLCRLKKYTNPQIGVRWLSAVEPMPVYDEYFILRPPTQTTAPSKGGTRHPVDDGIEKPARNFKKDVDINTEPGNSNTNPCEE